MYDSFYGFRAKPFTLNPDPAFLYMAPPHRRALTVLEYALASDAPFCLISGEVGSGKTTLLRHMLASLGKNYTVGLLNNQSGDFGPMLPWISNTFGLDHRDRDPVSLYQQFTDFLIAEYARGQKVLLIVDEAQNLNAQRLEELRVLSNINSDKYLVLQTVLVGQPELRDTIRSPRLRQLAQRIVADYHIEALDLEQTHTYVRHRLRKAGGKVTLFSNTAIRMAFVHSRGIPRLINQYCDRALVYGYADRLPQISGELMQSVIEDHTRSGLTAG
jgi:type II secretory pathway predicted ATPase ExeA